MALNLLSVIKEIYNTPEKLEALKRDLLAYRAMEPAYVGHREMILSAYKDWLQKGVLELKYTGSNEKELATQYAELTRWCKMIESVLSLEDDLAELLNGEKKAESAFKKYDPYDYE